MRDERMHVVYAASRNLYPFLPAAYESFLKYNPDAVVHLMIEDNELPYAVPENVECQNVSWQRWFAPAMCANWNTIFTYLSLIRVCYTKLLPDCDKVLSMDVDTITCESLKPLFDIDFSAGEYFAAVPEYLSEWNPFHTKKYYNAGVVVFSLENMRQEHADTKLIKFLNSVPATYIDQDAINWLNAEYHGKKAIDIGTRYNETDFTGRSLRPAVQHYAGVKNVWKFPTDEVYMGQYLEPWAHTYKIDECRAAGIKC